MNINININLTVKNINVIKNINLSITPEHHIPNREFFAKKMSSQIILNFSPSLSHFFPKVFE
jgi:hypothetical protein